MALSCFSLPKAPVAWVSALMFDGGDSNPARLQLPKVNDVRKPAHETPPNLTRDNHPTVWSCNQALDLRFESIQEFPTQARNLLVIVAADFPQFGFDRRMVLHPHARSRDMSSRCVSAFTSPDSTCRSRSTASRTFALSSAGMISNGSVKLSQSDSAKHARSLGGKRRALAASCSKLMLKRLMITSGLESLTLSIVARART